MTTIFENLFVFFVATPLGFLLLVSVLVYAEYLMYKNIMKTDPQARAWVNTAVRYVKVQTHSSRKYLHAMRVKIPAVYVKPYRARHPKRVL